MWADIAAGILGGAQVFGGFFQNKQNLEFQRWANEQNVMLTRETWDKNYNQWRESVELNKPKVQMANLYEAGLNPALAVGGLQNTKVSPITHEAPRVDPLHSDFHGSFQNIIAPLISLAQLKNINTETRGREIQNAFMAESLSADIERKKADTDKSRAGAFNLVEQVRQKDTELRLRGETVANDTMLMLSTLKLQTAEMENKAVQKRLMLLDEQTREITLKYADAKQIQDLQAHRVEINKMLEQIRLIKAEAQNEEIKNTLDGLAVSLATQTYQANVRFIEGRADMERYVKPAKAGFDAIGGAINAIGNAVSIPVKAAKAAGGAVKKPFKKY